MEERLGKGLANGLDAYARPPRSLREPTWWNQDKSPETIYNIHISLYASPAAHTPATIFARICIDKLVDNLHIPSHLKNANEHLPTQLCLRNKNLHCFRGCLRTPPRTVKYQVVSLRNLKRSSLEYIMSCIQKKTMLNLCSFLCIYGDGDDLSSTRLGLFLPWLKWVKMD